MADFDAIQILADSNFNLSNATNDPNLGSQLIANSNFNLLNATNDATPGVNLFPIGVGGNLDTYYMRARDTTLATLVFWTATFLDATGTAYGGPGPLTNIILVRKV